MVSKESEAFVCELAQWNGWELNHQPFDLTP